MSSGRFPLRMAAAITTVSRGTPMLTCRTMRSVREVIPRTCSRRIVNMERICMPWR